MKRVFNYVTIFLLLGAVAYLWAGIDWYAYGLAQPPVPPEIGSSLVELIDFKIDDVPIDEATALPAGEKVILSGELLTDVDHWSWPTGFISTREMKRREKDLDENRKKPSIYLRFDFLARSWHSPGYKLGMADRGEMGVWRARGFGGGRKGTESDRVTFESELPVPDRPGTHELRVIFKDPTRYEDAWDLPEQVIGSFKIQVSDEIPTSFSP